MSNRLTATPHNGKTEPFLRLVRLQVVYQLADIVNTSQRCSLSAGFYEKTDYFRVKDITLGYRLPAQWIRPVGLSRAEIYANVKNLYTWTTWTGLDPEFVGSGNAQRAIPQVREILIGLKLDF